MASNRDENIPYVRWQGFRAAQLTLCISLFLSFSLATLGFSVNLLVQKDYGVSNCYAKVIFLFSLIFGLLSVFLGAVACLTRLADFRTTAKVARHRDDRSMDTEVAQWRADYKRLGWWTWTLFKSQLLTAGFQLVSLLITLVITYWPRLT